MADPTLTGATITFQTNDDDKNDDTRVVVDVDAPLPRGRTVDRPQERRTIESLPRHKRTMIAI